MSDLDAVLAAVNVGRKALGKRALKKLPKGEAAEAFSCPLARAFGCPVDGRLVHGTPTEATKLAGAWDTTMTAGGLAVMPARLCHFANDFDEGAYPELERKP